MLILFYFFICFLFTDSGSVLGGGLGAISGSGDSDKKPLTEKRIRQLLSPEPKYKAKLHPAFESIFAVSNIEEKKQELKEKIEIFKSKLETNKFEIVQRLHYQIVDGMAAVGGGIKIISAPLVQLAEEIDASETCSFHKYVVLLGLDKAVVESAFYWVASQQKGTKISYQEYLNEKKELSEL